MAVTKALMEMAEKNPKIVLISADSVKLIRAEPFNERYPGRLIEAGIAEQNAVNIAAGLAAAGIIPYVVSYAGFLSMRACEQIRTFVAYTGLNVRLVGANGGIYAGEREGVTHQFFEDLGILRTIPGVTIISPADAGETYRAVIASEHIKGPVYIRIGSGRDPVVFEDDPPFETGKARIIAEYGKDVVIFTTGSITLRVLKAAGILAANGIKATVAEVHTIKPLDTEAIGKYLADCGCAVTVEDHNIIGGLGSAICETACSLCPVFVNRIGLMDKYPESGHAEKLLDAYGMGAADIVEAAVYAVKQKG